MNKRAGSGHLVALLTLVFISFQPVRAQQAAPDIAFPTVAALETTVVPMRDRVDLARRLLGINEVAPPPQNVPERQIGERETFWVMNSSDNLTFEVDATLRAAGDHIYLWVQQDVAINEGELQALAAAFDTRIYDEVRALWGSEDIPGIDGDPRVYGLFTYGLGSGVAAYFASEHVNPAEVVSDSNEHEMFIFNLDAIGVDDVDREDIEGIVAHEFQHMIRRNVDNNEDTWLDEGFSEFTSAHLGYTYSFGATLAYAGAPYTQLNTWSEQQPRSQHYGAALLFVNYFYERYGDEALAMLSSDPANGLTSVDNVLSALGQSDVNSLFADWAVANFVLDASLEDGRYGYRSLPWALATPLPRSTVTQYPYTDETAANQYSTNYYVLTNLDGVSALDVAIAAPPTTQLVPTTAHSGRGMWYSNRADNSDTTLTRAFDLSNVSAATLRFWTWYHFEEFWDYGYVMASADGGQTWQALATEYTTTYDPQQNAYGPGYTGRSGGGDVSEWVQETVSLDEYAGGEVLIRFEMITDDAIVQPGMVVDDVSIDEIGYAEDFEAGGGGWQAAGWLWTDNTLPQGAWVQAVQQFGDGTIDVTRWQVNAENSMWSLALSEGVLQVLLAVSPYAPVTTVPMPYTLTVSAR